MKQEVSRSGRGITDKAQRQATNKQTKIILPRRPQVLLNRETAPAMAKQLSSNEMTNPPFPRWVLLLIATT